MTGSALLRLYLVRDGRLVRAAAGLNVAPGRQDLGMAYVVEVAYAFRAEQGLPSAVRAGRGLPLLSVGAGVDVVLRAGVTFDDAQLTGRGWFFDTDAVAELLARWAQELGRGPWTARFDFRPTFELVARHVFRELSREVPQLAWVELEDRSFGTRTRYLAP